MQRAAKLGLKELFAFEDGRPVVCQSDNVTYLWQPLHRERADQVVRDPKEILVESLPTAVRNTERGAA